MNERTAFLMMASNVYGGPTSESHPFGEFITSLGSVEQRDIGFRAEAYRLEETGKIVVAIAGTNPLSIPSLINAAGIAAHVTPSEQVMAAVAFVRAVTDQYGPTTLVGHSSGGLVAQLLAAREQAKPEGAERLPIDRAVAFNSPGAAPFLPSMLGSNIPPLFENIESICDSRDFVCRYFDARGEEGMGSSHIGTIEYINPIHDSEPLYGVDLLNPAYLPQITMDMVLYHSVGHLLSLHAQSDPVPGPVFDGITGPLGIGVVTIEAVEIGEDPSPLEEGAQEFETFQTSSPLVLDLDGDGIETQGLLAGTFFDHAGDGFAELTGWIGADDGLLILDRNGNGAVDDGGELFGNETVLHDGARAPDGYQALAEFDQNGDGRVEASDPIWSQLRVWQDANGDGDSEPSELYVPLDIGVSAMNTGATPSTVIDTNGNEHRLVGTFARADGTTGETADVWFRVARRHAVAGEVLPVPSDVGALPNIQGHGTVHDLHQAIVRDPSGSLKSRVQQFIAEPDPARRSALLEPILFSWTGGDSADPGSRGPHIDARRLATLEHVYGEAFTGIEGTGNPNAEVGGLLNHTFQGFAELVYAQLMVQSQLRDLWASSRYTWDAGAERVRGDLSVVIAELHDLLAADPEAGRVALGEFARTVRGLGVETMVDDQAFRDAFADLGEDVAWIVDAGGKALVAGTANDDTLTGAATADALRGGDGNDILSGDDGDDVLYGQDGADTLIGGANADLLDGGTGNDALDGRRGNDRLLGQAGHDSLLGEAGDDVLEGGDGNDSLNGGDGNDLLAGGDGADVLLGRDHDDSLFGGDGDDSLTGNRGADMLAGEAGNDTLSGEGGADVLDGGAGTDVLEGGTESDTYRFGRGDGHDAIIDRDATPGNVDVIALGAGIAPDEVHATREADDLVLGIVGTGEQLRVISWFTESVPRQYEVEEVRFANSTSWDREALRQFVIVPTEGPDRFTGYSSADTLLGLGGDDTLAGGGGDDRLDGGAGNDALDGNEGNDTLLGGAGADSLRGNEGIDTLLGGEGDDALAGDRDDDVLAGEDGNDSLDGGGGIDHLAGGAGNDVLAGGSEADSLEGGPGNDALRGDDGDDVLHGGPGLDVISGNAGHDALYGGDDDDVLSGDRDDDSLVGDAGNDRLDGGPGIDAMAGGPGDDTYVVDDPADVPTESAGAGLDTVEASVNHTLRADVENLTLTGNGPIAGTGNGLHNRLTGNTSSNVLAGAAGDDILDGGPGLDWLAGGTGNDTYVLGDAGDVVLELTGEGTDLVQSALTYTLPPNVEDLALTATAPIHGTGNELNNRLTGGSEANTLDGGAGDDVLEGGAGDDTLIGGTGVDTMAGGPGDDTYVVDVGDTVAEAANAGADRIEVSVTYALPSNVENLTLTGTGAIDGTGNGLNNHLTGNPGANTLAGGAGNDLLDGGPGLDRLVGGAGNDTYVIADAGDVVVELAGEGTDVVQSALTYTLPANVEDLALTTTIPIHGAGNALNNRLTGNLGANTLTGGAGDDILDGGGGRDTLVGGAGNDTYIVTEAAVVVVENGNQGTDTIESAMTYALPGHVERLILLGAGAIDGTGNALSNILTGNGAANRLNGGAGIDAMAGMAGDDTYVVDHVAETVTETAGQGTDTIETDVTYALPANVERLILTGSGAINATGNALNNALTGNTKSNVLNGGLGADAMAGGSGNDTYVVDDVGDTIIEALNAGTDTTESAVSYALADNVERLTLTGAASINGTGNALNNTLTGNGGANLLDGGPGTDTMVGGAGDDTYVIDRATDTVQEAANGGIDTILAATTYVVPANVENATLTGLSAIGVTGNALGNVLQGNRGTNFLDGRAGNDTYLFGRGAGQDTIQDIDHTPANVDTLAFAPDLDPIDLIISRQINNLRIAVHGTADRVDVSTWYFGATNQIEVLRAGDGRQLLSTQVEQLVQAMAGHSAQSGLSWDQAVAQHPQEIEAILAAYWHPAGS